MNYQVGVLGLGYVGLPLAVEIGKKYPTIGFDVNGSRIEELKRGEDHTKEVERAELAEADQLSYTTESSDLRDCNFFIVTVPTPIDTSKRPDLTILKAATRTVSQQLGKGDIVVYESTVYPGCTEEVCVPILEEGSGLTFNQDFFCGYSPERINPGDKVHRLTTIKKVTSGSTPEIAKIVDDFYSSFVTAGTHLASSIKVAEAAKAIENAQRDINIAFVNELALIFERVGIDTHEVLAAAGTKWNFLNFSPGLVGGHCIGVDPYYLTYKAEELGHFPQTILAGRKVNDEMGAHVAQRVIKLLAQQKKMLSDTRVLVLGVTFKENCPDIRNSRVIDIVDELLDYNLHVDIYDPQADKHEVKDEYDIELISDYDLNAYAAVIVAVAHDEFNKIDWQNTSDELIIFDVKGFLPKTSVTSRL